MKGWQRNGKRESGNVEYSSDERNLYIGDHPRLKGHKGNESTQETSRALQRKKERRAGNSS